MADDDDEKCIKSSVTVFSDPETKRLDMTGRPATEITEAIREGASVTMSGVDFPDVRDMLERGTIEHVVIDVTIEV